MVEHTALDLDVVKHLLVLHGDFELLRFRGRLSESEACVPPVLLCYDISVCKG